MIEVRDLSFRYEDKTVLDGCSFAVDDGERLVIMGQSGCGKSTLLRLILGIITPSSGAILFEDQDLMKLPPAELNSARRKIGMVFQSAALISSLSVEENLALPLLELTDAKPQKVAKIVDEKLRLVGMQKTKQKLPAELSGGMRKRISLARALVLEPEMILFDEPSSGLDPVATSLIDELIVRLNEESGTTCIIVTHNMPSAFHVATRMAMLHEGTVVADGTPQEIRRSKDPIVHQFVTGSSEGPLAKGKGGEA